MTGEPDRPPVRVGTAAIDLHGSLALVSAVLAALFHRERTGEGQMIETSLLMSSAHLLSYFYTEYWMEGTVRKPMGTANHLSVPNQVFPTADGGVVIIAPNDEMWQRCVEALGEPSLDRPEYATTCSTACGGAQELVEAVSAVTRRMTSRDVVERLGAVKVNVAKVNIRWRSRGRSAARRDRRRGRIRGGRPRRQGGGEPVQSVRDAGGDRSSPAPNSTSIGQPSWRSTASPMPKLRRWPTRAPSAIRPRSSAPARSRRPGEDQAASRAEAILAPSASARSFLKAITGSTLL